MATIDLSSRTFFRLTGPDARRYLNGQVTQEVSQLEEGEVTYTFVCDLKGRIQSDAYIRALPAGDLLIDAPSSARESLLARLDRYLIADDCELIDETGKWQLLHHLEEASGPGQVSRFGSQGRDEIRPAGEPTLSAPSLSGDEAENLRIRAGIPTLQDLEGLFPAESGQIERAVSFAKGCYQGQEVISRMKRAGKTNKTLATVSLDERPEALPLTFSEPDGKKPVLTLTSVTSDTTGGCHAGLGSFSTKANLEHELVAENGLRARVTKRLN
ncbi:MAG: hypothetical protein Q7Q71_14035 [Verrucomicrobiota bacterium JB023]|nr:hypothetical protein [Verrucomicrobiota bacterium JB023]